MEELKKQIQSAVNLYKSGDFSKAELITKKLIDSNPQIVFLHNLLGLISERESKIEQAKNSYEKSIKIDPTFAMPYNNLGLLYFNHTSEVKKAEDLYKKAILIDKKIF